MFSFLLNTESFPEINFEITCSKGTYIRSIAHDFGAALQSGGTLTALRRTKSGDLSVDQAWQVEALIDHINESI